MILQYLLLVLPSLGAELTVDLLDVGQGDAILVRTEGHAALIDAGPRNANTEEQLKALGVSHLDLVVATHPHADHIGRMPNILETFTVGTYLDNGMTHTTKNYERVMASVAETRVDHHTARVGMAFPFGEEATFTVLFPGDTLLRGTRSDLNSNSVVLRLDHGASSFLFTGDAEAPTEGRLLGDSLDPVDVLKVAHHGSGHSSTGAFLARLQPQAALISCGRDNRYRHPYPEALERMRHVGALVYRTDVSGNIRAVSDGVGVEILEGSIAELDSVQIVPWPDPAVVAGGEPVSAPRGDADPIDPLPSVNGRRLKRRAYFARIEASGADMDRTTMTNYWRAYRQAWRLAKKMARRARSAEATYRVKEHSEA